MSTRKAVALLLALALVVVMLTGCGNSGTSTTDNTKTTDTASTDATKTETTETEEKTETTTETKEAEPASEIKTEGKSELQGTLNEGEADPDAIINLHLGSDFTNLDPALTSDGQGGILGFIMPPLMDTDKNFQLAPGIAESYTVNEESTEYTFKIREGVKFHDGTDCDAEAVKWNYDRQVGANATPDMPYAQTIFGKVTSIEAPDKYTVVFKLSESDGTLPIYLAMPNGCGLVSPTAWQKDPEGFRRNPVGAGPYKFVEWVADQHIKLERNDDYFGGEVQNAGVVMRVIKEPAVATSEFLAGTLDSLQSLPISDITQIEKSGYTVNSRPHPAYSYVVFADYENNQYFKDEKVRQAIWHALDIKSMVEGVYQGRNQVAKSYIPPNMVGGVGVDFQTYEYDVAKAEALLDEAGFPKDENGQRFTVSYISRNEPWNAQMAVAIQMELAKIGIKVDVQLLARPDWLTKGLMETPDYDMIGRNWGAASNDTSYMAQLFTSQNAVAGGLNIPKYKNPEFDALVNEARTTGDVAKQAELYAKSAQILNDDAPIVFLEQHVSLWANQPNLIDPEGVIGWFGVNYWWKIGKAKK